MANECSALHSSSLNEPRLALCDDPRLTSACAHVTGSPAAMSNRRRFRPLPNMICREHQVRVSLSPTRLHGSKGVIRIGLDRSPARAGSSTFRRRSLPLGHVRPTIRWRSTPIERCSPLLLFPRNGRPSSRFDGGDGRAGPEAHACDGRGKHGDWARRASMARNISVGLLMSEVNIVVEVRVFASRTHTGLVDFK